ncbi:MAG TPA: response regulator [Candidatus Obscuribacterales bacterium]
MNRILLIEDDRQFAEILQESLEEEDDIKVVEVIGDEHSAAARIRNGLLGNVDCVVLDLQLPPFPNETRVDPRAGLRLLEMMRQEERYYGNIIVLTSSRSVADGQRALAAGCDAYLCKCTPVEEIPSMLFELRLAVRGNAIVVSKEMRHVFMREDISAKEARMLDLLSQGKGWSEIARELGYKTAKAAANVGDRIFDKILTPDEKRRQEESGIKKRIMAVEVWRARQAKTHVSDRRER